MRTNSSRTDLLFLAFVVLIVLAFISLTSQHQASASVSVSSEYAATTTNAAQVPAERLLKTGTGALAQVTVTGQNNGTMYLYNATTSDVNKRTGNPATSTITIAEIASSTPAGTYTFDASFGRGLLLVTTGSPATSTITYR